MISFYLNQITVESGAAGASSGAYKPPSMRAGASQASSASAGGGKKMDFGGGRGPLNKGIYPI